MPPPWSRDAAPRRGRDRTPRHRDDCRRGRDNPFRPSSGRRCADCGSTSSANAARGCRRALRDDGSAASPGPAPKPRCRDRRRRSACRRRSPRSWCRRRCASVPSAPQCMPVMSDAGTISIKRPRRDAAAAAFGKISAGGAEFDAAVMAAAHAAALPLSAAIRRSGRIGNSSSRMPMALWMALATAGEVGTVATSPMPTLPPST